MPCSGTPRQSSSSETGYPAKFTRSWSVKFITSIDIPSNWFENVYIVFNAEKEFDPKDAGR